MAVISLALVVKQFTSESKTTVLLHMTDEKPGILKTTLQLLQIVLAKESMLYTESIEEYLKKERHSQMVLISNLRSVNDMEFDDVIVFISYLEYYLKFYLPQVISRCTFNLNLVLLPNGKETNKHTNMVITKDTVTNVIQKFKQECLMEQTDAAEWKTCYEVCNCCYISDIAYNNLTFLLHSHSVQYKEHKNTLEFIKKKHSSEPGGDMGEHAKGK